MIGALAVALLVPQDATGALGKLRWPPHAEAEPASYRIELVKTRTLDDATRKAERAARREAGLHAPARPPRQEITLVVTAELTPGADAVAGRYTVELGRSSLRWELIDEAEAELASPVPFRRLWGLPDAARDPEPVVYRAKIEGVFEHATRRTAPNDRPRGAPDVHLLPVFWEGALPAWIEHVVAIAELADVTVVPGKAVIREAIAADPLGQRSSRVQVTFVRGSSTAVEITYELTVVQRVDRSRIDGTERAEPYEWHLDVEGGATFSLEHGRFLRVEERVTGRLPAPPADRLVDLRDEVFEGRIRIEFVPKEPEPERRGRRRR